MLRYIKHFESFQDLNQKNFYNTSALDIKKMSLQEIIQVIKNTFGTADLIWEDASWNVLVTNWKKLTGEGNSLSMSARMISEIGDEEVKKVYFHIHTLPESNFTILRSNNKEALKVAIDDLSNWGGQVESGVNSSAIINFNRPSYSISFSSRPIDPFKQSTKDDEGLHTLQPMVTNEINLDTNLAQISNILIGQNIISRRSLYRV